MPSRRQLDRFLRWRLRTVLGLITVLAILLGCYVRLVTPYRVQFLARNKLEAAGAGVEAETAEPAWLGTLVGKKRYHRVVSVLLRSRSATDKDIAPIANLPHLRKLYLNYSGVTDEGAKYIGRVTTLQRLSLWRTRITDNALQHLAQCSQLKVLDIHSNCITDRGLTSLESLQNLRQLTLG